MPKTAISNRQRKAAKRTSPTAPRMPKATDAEKVVKVAAPARDARTQEPADRDGLLWLVRKKRLTTLQIGAGIYYRDLFRAAAPGIMKSCLDGAEGGGVYNAGKGGGLPFEGEYLDGDAQLQLFVIRSLTLGEQPDLVTVMDGVCGIGHTVRYLAGGDQLRAAQLEAALRIALDLVVAVRAAKSKALKKAA